MSMLAARPGVIAASRRRSAGTGTVLGYSTRGAATAAGAGFTQVSKFTLASSGTVTELHGWFVGTGTAGACRILIYDDDGASAAAGTRLGYTNSITIPATATDYHLSETGLSVALAAGDYYIGFILQDGNGQATYETTGSTSYRNTSGATYTPPATPFPGSTAGTRKTSCWGIVT